MRPRVAETPTPYPPLSRNPGRRSLLGALMMATGAFLFAPQAATASDGIRERITADTPNIGIQLAQAQKKGQVRAQGKTVKPKKKKEEIQRGPPPKGKFNYRNPMRQLVQEISQYARGEKDNFAIIARDGLDLVERYEDTKQPGKKPVRNAFPARGFMRAIDGLLVDSVYYGGETFDKVTPQEARAEQFHFIGVARQGVSKLFTMDFARNRTLIGRAQRASLRQRFIPFVAHKPRGQIDGLPPFPGRPVNENATHVFSIANVRNYAYLPNSSPLGNQQQFTLKMKDTNYDLLIVDVFHGGRPLTKQAVETLKYKKLGSRRLVMARVDIGTASNDRYYWRPAWRVGSPAWIRAPYPGDDSRFFVRYWRPEWKRILFGNTNSYIYGLIDQGYDGVVLEGLNAYKFFETDGKDLSAFK